MKNKEDENSMSFDLLIHLRKNGSHCLFLSPMIIKSLKNVFSWNPFDLRQRKKSQNFSVFKFFAQPDALEKLY